MTKILVFLFSLTFSLIVTSTEVEVNISGDSLTMEDLKASLISCKQDLFQLIDENNANPILIRLVRSICQIINKTEYINFK